MLDTCNQQQTDNNNNMTAKLLTCSSCKLTFTTPETYREHAKSEEQYVSSTAQGSSVLTRHSITKLRQRAAASGADIRSKKYEKFDANYTPATDSSSDADTDVDETERTEAEFVAETCIFCGEDQESFEDNLVHMASTHSFIIPFQDALVVDLQTLVWYFHLAIYSYNECIKCGKRRHGVQAVQQHMKGAGHCRFDLDGEVTDFYDLSKLDARTAGNIVANEDSQLELPSGRVASQRSQTMAPNKPRSNRRELIAKEPEQDQHMEGQEEVEEETSTALLNRNDRRAATISDHMGQLSKRDQLALAHLPSYEQRTVLRNMKKEIDASRRIQRRMRNNMMRHTNNECKARYVGDAPGKKMG